MISSSVQYKNPYRCLTSTKSLVEDDLGDYYCEACGKRRNPKYPVYYCKECCYIAHVTCGISEVLPSLVKDYEDQLIAQGGPSDNWLGEMKAEISSLRSLKDGVLSRVQELEDELKGRQLSRLELEGFKG